MSDEIKRKVIYWLNTQQAALVMGVSKNTVMRKCAAWAEEGNAIQYEGRWYINPDAAQAYRRDPRGGKRNTT